MCVIVICKLYISIFSKVKHTEPEIIVIWKANMQTAWKLEIQNSNKNVIYPFRKT